MTYSGCVHGDIFFCGLAVTIVNTAMALHPAVSENYVLQWLERAILHS
jgi:hypothetical protein